MLTLPEAQAFIKTLFENVFENKKYNELNNFYLPDARGHFREEILSVKDIENRLKSIKENTEYYHFPVQEVIVFDNFISVSSKQQWKNKNDNSLHELLVFLNYRIQDKKIAEWWLLLETAVDSYKEINLNFQEKMRPFEVSHKHKKAFFERLSSILGKFDELSRLHKECLYYYLQGLSSKEVAQILKLSPRTVESYLAIIRSRLDSHSRSELRGKLF